MAHSLPLGSYDWARLGPPGLDASRLAIKNYEDWLESTKPPVATLDWRITNDLRRNEEIRAQKAAAAVAQEAQRQAAQLRAEQAERAKQCGELYRTIWKLWIRGEAGSPQCQTLVKAYAVARGFLAPGATFGSDDTYQRVNRDLNSGDAFHRWGNQEIFCFKRAAA